MYTQAGHRAVQAEARKRLLITWVPCAAMLAAGVALFVLCQIQRQAWGWVVAWGCTLLGGAYGLFLDGVYAGPVRSYGRHVDAMLTGKKREITGVVEALAQEITCKDGLDCHALTLRVDEMGSPKEERLLYLDVQIAWPPLSLGERLLVQSCGSMVFDIQKA